MIGQSNKMRDAHPSVHCAHKADAYVRTLKNPYLVSAGRDYGTRSTKHESFLKLLIREPFAWIGLRARRLGYFIRRTRARLG